MRRPDSNRRNRFSRLSATRSRVLSGAIAALFASGETLALPVGPAVVNGTASIAQVGNALTINNSAGAILNWQKFSIGADELVRFNQPSAASSVLNRVLAADPSVIYGQLSSNGKVFLINPAGILVGAGAKIDTAGFVASTLGISNSDFLAGKLNFKADGSAGSVINQGEITTPLGGNVYLIGSQVTNQGLITTPQGETILAAGATVSLIDTATPGVKVDITGAEGNVTNLGQITADAGRIGMAGVLVRNSGQLNASSVVNQGGRIFLKASQDTYVDGNGRMLTTGSTGGSVEILGQRVAVTDQAQVDASGEQGGGQILVGGDYQGKNQTIQNAQVTYVGKDTQLKASATLTGAGGKVIVWSDDTTRAYGRIEAKGGPNGGDGGFIETSGKRYLDVAGIKVSAGGTAGAAGVWLLDPADITITQYGGLGYSVTQPFAPTGATGTITDADINATLDSGTDVTITTAAGTGGAGDITVYGTVVIENSSGAARSLNFHADGDFNANAGSVIRGTGSGRLNLEVNATGAATFAGSVYTYGGTLSVYAGNALTISGPAFSSAQTVGAAPYNGGNIWLQGSSVTATTDLVSNGFGYQGGNAGNVTVIATSGNATLGYVSAVGGYGYAGAGFKGGHGGNVSVEATSGNIAIGSIAAMGADTTGSYAHSGVSPYGGGAGGTIHIRLNDPAGNIQVGGISTIGGSGSYNNLGTPAAIGGAGGNGGNVSIEANGGYGGYFNIGSVNADRGANGGSDVNPPSDANYGTPPQGGTILFYAIGGDARIENQTTNVLGKEFRLKADGDVAIMQTTLEAGPSAGSSPTSTPTPIILHSDADDSGAGAVSMHLSALWSYGGDITIGGGADPHLNPAMGFATGAPGISGVLIFDSSLDAAGGDISIRGKAYTAGVDALQFNGVQFGATTNAVHRISTTGLGNILIAGEASNLALANGSSWGVLLDPTTTGLGPSLEISTGGGAITIAGTSSGALFGYQTKGVEVSSSVNISTTSGSIDITGIGGTSGTATNNIGIRFSGNPVAPPTIVSSSGNISITGYGGHGSASPGVEFLVGTLFETAGNITIHGETTASGNNGIEAFLAGSAPLVISYGGAIVMRTAGVSPGLSLGDTEIHSHGGAISAYAGGVLSGSGEISTTRTDNTFPYSAGNIWLEGTSINFSGNLSADGYSALGGHGADITANASAGDLTLGFVSAMGSFGTGTNGGDGGNLFIDATGALTIGGINTSGGGANVGGYTGGHAGNVNLSSNGLITVGNIAASGGNGFSGGGTGGHVVITASAGAVAANAITANGGLADGGDGGDAGSVTIQAATTIGFTSINAVGGTPTFSNHPGGVGGAVTLTAGGNISGGPIDTSGGDGDGYAGGNAGGIGVTSTAGSVTLGTLTAVGGAGYYSAPGNGGAVSVQAAGSIGVGFIDTHGGTVGTDGGYPVFDGAHGGSVQLTASGTGTAIQAAGVNATGGFGVDGGNGGNITISALNGGIDLTALIVSDGGTAGDGYFGVFGQGGAGGTVTINAGTAGVSSAGIQVNGGGHGTIGGLGGTVSVTAANGPIAFSSAILATGGYGYDAGGNAASVMLNAGTGTIAMSAPIIAVGGGTSSNSGSYGGNGGMVDIAAGTFTLTGNIDVRGSFGYAQGGHGGSVDITAGAGGMAVTGQILAKGAGGYQFSGVGGHGGTVTINSAGAVTFGLGGADTYTGDPDSFGFASIDTRGGFGYNSSGYGGAVDITATSVGPTNVAFGASISTAGGGGCPDGCGSVAGHGGTVNMNIPGAISNVRIFTDGGAYAYNTGANAGAIGISAGSLVNVELFARGGYGYFHGGNGAAISITGAVHGLQANADGGDASLGYAGANGGNAGSFQAIGASVTSALLQAVGGQAGGANGADGSIALHAPTGSDITLAGVEAPGNAISVQATGGRILPGSSAYGANVAALNMDIALTANGGIGTSTSDPLTVAGFYPSSVVFTNTGSGDVFIAGYYGGGFGGELAIQSGSNLAGSVYLATASGGAELVIEPAGVVAGGDVRYVADKLNVSGDTHAGATATVTVTPFTATRPIALVATADPAQLSLSAAMLETFYGAELALVTAGPILVGYGGAVSVAAQNFNKLSLDSGNGITQDNALSLPSGMALELIAATGVQMTHAGNAFGAGAGVSGSAGTLFDVTSTSALVVGDISGGSGGVSLAAGGGIAQLAATTINAIGTVTFDAGGGVTQGAGATISSAVGVDVTAVGGVFLNEAGNVLPGIMASNSGSGDIVVSSSYGGIVGVGAVTNAAGGILLNVPAGTLSGFDVVSAAGTLAAALSSGEQGIGVALYGGTGINMGVSAPVTAYAGAVVASGGSSGVTLGAPVTAYGGAFGGGSNFADGIGIGIRGTGVVAEDLIMGGGIGAIAIDAGTGAFVGNGAISATGTATVEGVGGVGVGVKAVGVTLDGIVNADSGLAILSAGIGTFQLAYGGQVASGALGNAIQIHGGAFVNNSGFADAALSTPDGHWLTWTNNPGLDTLGGLLPAFRQYNATFGVTAVQGSGSGNLYAADPATTLVLSGTTTKPYDTNTASDGSGLSLGFTTAYNDVVTFGMTAVTYDSKDVGTGKLVAATTDGNAGIGVYGGSIPVFGITISGAASNYGGAITPATIASVSGLVADNKVYDGTTAAVLSGGGTFAGLLGTDVVQVDSATAVFADKNVGTGKTVNVTGIVLGGADAGNYTLANTNSTTTADITAYGLTVSGALAANKVYDATTTAIITGGTLNTLGSDVVSYTGGGTFADKNVGTGKAVTAALTLTGADVGNYTLLAQPTGLTANITPATISTVTGISANNKTYDGNTSATLNTGAATFVGMYGGDTLTATGTGTFTDRHVGTGKTVNITGIALGGTDVGNYTLTTTTGTSTANITQLASVSWTGGGDGINWFNAANWSGSALPDRGNVAAVSVGAAAVTYNNAVPADDAVLTSLTGTGNFTLAAGTLTTSGGLTTGGFAQTGGTLAGTGGLTVGNSFSKSGGTLSLTGAIAITQASGDLILSNAGALTFGNLHAANGDITIDVTGGITTIGTVTAPAGSITGIAHSPMTIGGAVTAANDITLVAGATGSPGDDLTLNAPVTSTGNGTIDLFAGDNLMQNANVSTNGGNVFAQAQTGSITMSAAASTSSNGGYIDYYAPAGNITLASLNAGTGSVFVTANPYGGGVISSAPGFSGTNITAFATFLEADSIQPTSPPSFTTRVTLLDAEVTSGIFNVSLVSDAPPTTTTQDVLNEVTKSTEFDPVTQPTETVVVATFSGTGNTKDEAGTTGGGEGTFGEEKTEKDKDKEGGNGEKTGGEGEKPKNSGAKPGTCS